MRQLLRSTLVLAVGGCCGNWNGRLEKAVVSLVLQGCRPSVRNLVPVKRRTEIRCSALSQYLPMFVDLATLRVRGP